MKIIDALEPPKVEPEVAPVAPVVPPPAAQSADMRVWRDTLRGVVDRSNAALTTLTEAVNQKMKPEFHFEFETPPIEFPERKPCTYECKVKNHQTGAEYTMTFKPLTA